MNITFYKEERFKDTPIGKIPEEWRIVKFGDVCKFKRGFSYRSNQITKEPTKIRFITINDVEKEGGLKQGAERIYIKEDVNVNPSFFLEKEDVLIANTDMSKGFIIGAPILIENLEDKLVYSMDLTKLIFNKSEINSKFLFYYLTHKPVRQRMKSFAQGTNVLHLNLNLVRNMKIPLPPLEEQKAIAYVLSTVDKAIQKTNEIIEKVKRLKKGLMQKLLTRGVTLGFMFDTNIFDEILNERIELPQGLKYYVTHVQLDEILNMPDSMRERKEKLLKLFHKVPKDLIATEGVVYGVSRYDMAKYMSDEDAELYEKMLRRLRALDGKSGKRKSFENQIRDVLIALTCLKNCLTLVTNDKNLKIVAQEFGCPAITFKQFLRGEYREYKNTEIGRIPKEWKVVALEEVSLKIKTGPFGSQLKKSKLSETGVKVYTQENVLKKNFSIGNLYINYDKFKKLKSMEVKPGDVLLTIRGTTGFSAVFPENAERGIIHTNLAFVRVKTDLLYPEYLSILINDYSIVKSQIVTLSSATTLGALYAKHIKRIKIPLPSLSEQQKITKILLTVDKRLEVERKRKEKLERIKKALMDLLLTGKVRVKVY